MSIVHTRALVVAAAAVVIGLSASSCTFLVKAESAQCETDTDCTGRGGAFVGTSCGPSKTCLPVDGYCATNQDCIDRAKAETFFCQKDPVTPANNKCVGLLTPECPKLLADPGDLSNDNAIIAGSLWMPSWSLILQAGQDGMEMARADFKQTASGIQGRPLVIVACDIPIAHPERHTVAIDHLVDTVKVPFMVGPLAADWVNYAITHGAPKNVAVLTPDSTRLNFAGTVGDGLFFTNGSPGTVESEPLIVSLWEQRLRAAGKTGDVKLALLSTGLAADVDLAKFFHDKASFNGKSIQDNANNYLEADYGDISDISSPSQSQALVQAVNQVLAFKPDIVACFAPGCDLAIQAIEGNGVHPVYILSSISANAPLRNFMEGQPNGLQRVLGQHPGRPATDPSVQTFVSRFNAKYPEDDQQYGLAAQTYDLVYFASYAIAALGNNPVDGRGIGNAILSKFTVDTGVPVTTQPSSIFPAFQALQAGQTLKLDGTQTVGTFLKNGSLTNFVQSVWCFDSKANTNNLLGIIDSGLYLSSDAPAGSLQGTFSRCFAPSESKDAGGD